MKTSTRAYTALSARPAIPAGVSDPGGVSHEPPSAAVTAVPATASAAV